MKAKVVCVLSALLLSTALVACGGDDEGSDKSQLADTGFSSDTTTSDGQGDLDTLQGTDSSTGEGDTNQEDTASETADLDTASEDDSDTGPEQLSGNPCEDNPWPCHPVSNEGCSGGEACDWTELDGVLGFFCNEGSSAHVGESCNQLEGPWCVAGATCLAPGDAEQGDWSGAFCVKYCCTADDCGDGEECASPDDYWQYVTPDSLGVCL